jgi:hypothetical protein
MGITLLTPTGGRPEAFALCERWAARQTYKGEIQWLVADDCDPPTKCTMGQTVIRPEPRWKPGENTQFRNLLALLPLVRFDKIIHFEDDDAYLPTYIETMARRLDEAPLVGETPARYYNVRFRTWRDCGNNAHASLFQTAMRADILPVLKRICERQKWIDMALWPAVPGGKLFHGEETVGIKGMPGRAGQVAAHRKQTWMNPDPHLDVLRRWIGDDVAEYRRYGK